MVLAVPYTISEDKWKKYNTGSHVGIQKGSDTWNLYYKKESGRKEGSQRQYELRNLKVKGDVLTDGRWAC